MIAELHVRQGRVEKRLQSNLRISWLPGHRAADDRPKLIRASGPNDRPFGSEVLDDPINDPVAERSHFLSAHPKGVRGLVIGAVGHRHGSVSTIEDWQLQLSAALWVK
jgi:hypothetical protein